VNIVLSPQKPVLSPSLEKILGDHQIAHIPCLCDVRGYIAQGKQILIDEELEYSNAVLNL
jgi:hypothetical protein